MYIYIYTHIYTYFFWKVTVWKHPKFGRIRYNYGLWLWVYSILVSKEDTVGARACFLNDLIHRDGRWSSLHKLLVILSWRNNQNQHLGDCWQRKGVALAMLRICRLLDPADVIWYLAECISHWTLRGDCKLLNMTPLVGGFALQTSDSGVQDSQTKEQLP